MQQRQGVALVRSQQLHSQDAVPMQAYFTEGRIVSEGREEANRGGKEQTGAGTGYENEAENGDGTEGRDGGTGQESGRGRGLRLGRGRGRNRR